MRICFHLLPKRCSSQRRRPAHGDLSLVGTDHWCSRLANFTKQLSVKKLNFILLLFSERQGLPTLFGWSAPVSLTLVNAGLVSSLREFGASQLILHKQALHCCSDAARSLVSWPLRGCVSVSVWRTEGVEFWFLVLGWIFVAFFF